MKAVNLAMSKPFVFLKEQTSNDKENRSYQCWQVIGNSYISIFLLHSLSRRTSMTTTMASHPLLPHLLPLLATLFARILASDTSIKTSLIYPFNCASQIKTCNAFLYHMNNRLPEEQVASFYCQFVPDDAYNA